MLFPMVFLAAGGVAKSLPGGTGSEGSVEIRVFHSPILGKTGFLLGFQSAGVALQADFGDLLKVLQKLGRSIVRTPRFGFQVKTEFTNHITVNRFYRDIRCFVFFL